MGTAGPTWPSVRCDVLLVLGSRLDIRQTGADVRRLPGRDHRPRGLRRREINNRLTGCSGAVSQLAAVPGARTLKRTGGRPFSRPGWRQQIEQWRQQWPDAGRAIRASEGINPNRFMHAVVGTVLAMRSAYVVDVGQHQMWAAQSLEIGREQRFLTIRGMGAMGFALPAAIGSPAPAPPTGRSDRRGRRLPVNLQELQTVAHHHSANQDGRHRQPVSLGMVRQFQQEYFESRYQSTCGATPRRISFEWLKRTRYGSRSVSDLAEPPKARGRTVERSDWAPLLQVMVDASTNVSPKARFGQPLTESGAGVAGQAAC